MTEHPDHQHAWSLELSGGYADLEMKWRATCQICGQQQHGDGPIPVGYGQVLSWWESAEGADPPPSDDST